MRLSSICISRRSLQVERAERLVEQQHARPQDERARQRDPLLLAAGELARPAIGIAAQLHQLERLVGEALSLGPRRRRAA